MEIEGAERVIQKGKKAQQREEDSQKAMDEFIDEIEQDKAFRKNINLYPNEAGSQAQNELDEEMVQINELV